MGIYTEPVYLVDGEFTPNLSYNNNSFVFDSKKWCAIIAGKEFLRMSEPERMAYAEDFFRNFVADIARECGYDVGKLHDWFIRYAVKNVESLPVEVCSPDIYNPQRDVEYCDINIKEKPGVELLRFMLRPHMLKRALLFFAFIYPAVIFLFYEARKREDVYLVFENKET